MNVHKNARLTPLGRERVVKQVLERVSTPAAASAAAGVSLKTIYKWLSRFRNEGAAGLWDRRSKPKRLRCSLSTRQCERIERLRRERRPYREIARARAALLAPAPTQASAAPESVRAFWQRVAGIDLERCPHCQLGTLRLVQILAPRIRPPP